MPLRPSSTSRELLALYARAGHGERNLGALFQRRPELAARLGVSVDLSQDDAELALALAPAIGKYKKYAAKVNAAERLTRAERAAALLAASARHESERVVLDADVLLGELLAGTHSFVCLELETVRIAVRRHVLVKARGALRTFLDLTAFVDERGLHLAWRGGGGGLNLRPQSEEREASVLHVDLRRARRVGMLSSRPVLLSDVLAELGLM